MDEKKLERALGLSVLGTKHANHARVFVVQNGGDPFYAKAPCPWQLESLSERDRWVEADRINAITEAFYRVLDSHAVPLPDMYETMILDGGYPLHLISDEGMDCSEILSRSPDRVREIVEGIVEAISRVLIFGDEQVGMDPLLSNFALNGRGMRYIDIFPPLVKYEGKYVVHYPNPSEEQVIRREVERKFTPFGILRRLRFELISRNPVWERVFYDVIRERLDQSLLGPVMRHFRNLPDARLSDAGLSQQDRREIFLHVNPLDVDGLREFAAKAIPLTGASRKEVMDKIFDLTSFVRAKDLVHFHERVGRYRQLVEPYL